MALKGIKGIFEDVWQTFKIQADIEDKSLAEHFTDLVERAQSERKNVKAVWKKILSSKSSNPESYGKLFEKRLNEFRAGFEPRA